MNTRHATILRYFLPVVIGACLFAAAELRAQSESPTASQLSQNIATQLSNGNSQGALVVANTLVKRYPDSPEAAVARKQIVKLQAKVHAARAVAAKKNKAEYTQLLGHMRREEDAVEHDTFFTDRRFPSSGSPNTFVELYIGQKKSGSAWLRTKLQYGGESWIFFTTVKFSVDGTTVSEKDLGFFHVERDNNSSGVREWVDMPVDDTALPIFDALASGKQVIVRFDGKYRKDLVLSANSKAAIRDTLRLYRLMKQGVQS